MSKVTSTGYELEKAEKVAIMIHGRGADAENILSLKHQLQLDNFALFAPQAPNHSWYPYSFMAPDKENASSLSQALSQIQEIIDYIKEKGKSIQQCYFIGFSQGACLSLEYTSRKAQKYGGVIAFTGGLIGENIDPSKYKGDFENTPVFIGASHKDPHIPLSRIEASAELIQKKGAQVKTYIFPDTLHTIRKEEIDWVNRNILV